MVPAEVLTPHAGLILDSLRETRRAVQSYGSHPSHEFKVERLADIDAAIAAVRSLRPSKAEKRESE